MSINSIANCKLTCPVYSQTLRKPTDAGKVTAVAFYKASPKHKAHDFRVGKRSSSSNTEAELQSSCCKAAHRVHQRKTGLIAATAATAGVRGRNSALIHTRFVCFDTIRGSSAALASSDGSTRLQDETTPKPAQSALLASLKRFIGHVYNLSVSQLLPGYVFRASAGSDRGGQKCGRFSPWRSSERAL